VLDFESLCADARVLAALPHDRERLAREIGSRPLGEVPRSVLFRRWLQLRRAEETDLPGAILDRTFRVARILGLGLGFFLGASAAGGYLLYFGREPVNPFWFVLWLVLVPILFSVGVIILARAWHDWSGPGALARWLVGTVCRRLPGPARTAWQAWTGIFARHRDRHGRLAVLPLLGISQRAAAAFAAGALVTLWLRVVFTDLAFGWQSSAGWSAETWHAIARAIAAPWTWLFPGACPTVEEVRATHFTFAGGMREIDPTASRGWWPFLAGCLFFWGVALRTTVVILIDWQQRRALRNPDFAHSDANAVYRALTGPLFVGEARTTRQGAAEESQVSVPHAPGRAWMVLAPEVNDRAALERAIAAGVGGSVAATYAVAVDDPGGNPTALAAVSTGSAPVAVLLPASRDPILAIKKTLGAIAAACAGRECVILLRGDSSRLALWRKFAAAHRLELEMIPVP
jgi:hypothetical protein